MLARPAQGASAYNPISNPKRARIRQLYIIERMQDNGSSPPRRPPRPNRKT